MCQVQKQLRDWMLSSTNTHTRFRCERVCTVHCSLFLDVRACVRMCVCLRKCMEPKLFTTQEKKQKHLPFAVTHLIYTIYNYQTNTADGYLLFRIQLIQTLRNSVSIFPSGYPFFLSDHPSSSSSVSTHTLHIDLSIYRCYGLYMVPAKTTNTNNTNLHRARPKAKTKAETQNQSPEDLRHF